MTKNIKKLLIIGGTGFIGYHVAKEAIKRKWTVESISINKPKKIRRISKVKYIHLDISKKNQLKNKIKKKYSFVINLGGYVDHTYANREKTLKSHYMGCKNLCQILSSDSLKTFLQMGSSAEYENYNSPHKEIFDLKVPKQIYAKSKFLASRYLINLYKKEKFPVTILRLYQAYGPKQDTNRLISIVIDACLKNKKFPCSDGKQYRDFVHIDDLVRSIFLCYNNKKALGQIINIGSGKPKKIKNIIKFISNFLKSGIPEFGKIRTTGKKSIYPNIIKAKKILGWSPKVKFYSGLLKTIKTYKKQDRNKTSLY